MPYIIRVKMGGEYKPVTRVYKTKINYCQQAPNLDNEHNRWAWYHEHKNDYLTYKTASRADKMVTKLSNEYPDFLFEKLELEDKLGVFECCPECGGDLVIQIAHTEYNQVFRCDDNGYMVQEEIIGITDNTNSYDYRCNYCGQYLTGYEFNFKE